LKITIQRSALLAAVSQVAKAVSAKDMIPVLQGILIESQNGSLNLTGSDNVFTIRTTLEDYVEAESGAAVIAAKKLLEVIKKLPNKEVSITSDDVLAEIKCAGKTVTLPIMDSSEYPRKALSLNNPVHIIPSVYRDMVDSTKFAASTSEQTPVLMGINLQFADGELTAVATNRHRLAKRVITLDTDLTGSYPVPSKILDEVAKTSPETMQIWLSADTIHIQADDYQYTSQLLSGAYPDVSRIVPTSAKVTVLVDRAELIQALDLAGTVSEEKTKIVNLAFGEKSLKVSVRDNDTTMEEEIAAEVSGGEMLLSANSKYLLEAVKAIAADKVEFWLTGPMAPIVMRGQGNDSGTHLVLPYRTTGA